MNIWLNIQLSKVRARFHATWKSTVIELNIDSRYYVVLRDIEIRINAETENITVDITQHYIDITEKPYFKSRTNMVLQSGIL